MAAQYQVLDTLAALFGGDLFRQVAVDVCCDSIAHHDVHKQAWAIVRGLLAMGYGHTFRCD